MLDRLRWFLLLSLCASLAFWALGCDAPEPPTVTSEKVVVTKSSAQGLDLEVTLNAKNPNSIKLTARSIKAKVTINQSTELAEVTVPTKVSLPAKKTTQIVVPVKVQWGAAAAMALAAMNSETIPFTMKGTANIGGDSLNVSLPFTVQGTLTRQQLIDAVQGAIPQLPF
jgi:LEA14-like dessication related protein